MAIALNRVIIFVGNVRKCAQFYTDIFGLHPTPGSHVSDEWIELEAGGCKLAFHKAHGTDGPTGSEMNPHKIVFHAPDVAKLRGELIAKGVKMGELNKYGPLHLCDGVDVEGHVFQICNR